MLLLICSIPVSASTISGSFATEVSLSLTVPNMGSSFYFLGQQRYTYTSVIEQVGNTTLTYGTPTFSWHNSTVTVAVPLATGTGSAPPVFGIALRQGSEGLLKIANLSSTDQDVHLIGVFSYSLLFASDTPNVESYLEGLGGVVDYPTSRPFFLYVQCFTGPACRNALSGGQLPNTGSVSFSFDVPVARDSVETLWLSVGTYDSISTPEPNSLILLGSGTLGLFGVARCKMNA